MYDSLLPGGSGHSEGAAFPASVSCGFPLQSIACTSCSGSANGDGSQTADVGSISLNGFDCCVLIGAAAIGGACSCLCSASDEAAKFTGSLLGGWCQAAKVALIANVWFGLPVCRMGGLPGGNLWSPPSPENCGLFCITGAVGSVIEDTWRV